MVAPCTLHEAYMGVINVEQKWYIHSVTLSGRRRFAGDYITFVDVLTSFVVSRKFLIIRRCFANISCIIQPNSHTHACILSQISSPEFSL